MGQCPCSETRAERELREIELATSRARLRSTEEEAARKDAEWTRDHPVEARIRAERERVEREARDARRVAERREAETQRERERLELERAPKTSPDPLLTFVAGAALGAMF